MEHREYAAKNLDYEPGNGHTFIPASEWEPEGFEEWLWENELISGSRDGGYMSEARYYELSDKGEEEFAAEIEKQKTEINEEE